MPRKPRLFLPEATYHVYCRVARGEFVFDDDEEAIEFVDVAKRVRDLDGWKILAWCLMGNHYHLVVKTGAVPLWKSMARLQGAVSRGFNRRRRYLGRLWQSRYRARLVDSQEYFLQVVSYVHLNPVAARVVEDPVDYPHCGHREIIGRGPSRLVDSVALAHGFGCDTVNDARIEYLKWIRAVAEAKWHELNLRDLPWWTGARDVDEVVPKGEHPDATTYEGLPVEDDRPTLSIEEFIRRFEEHSNWTIVELSSPRRSEHLIRGRVELTLLAVGRYGLQSGALADLICKNRSSLTRWLNFGLGQLGDDAYFRERIDDLDRQIARQSSTMQQ
jgi:REP element-mobilizing transposase RayT